ncbi:MAG: cytochrome ubiquinol oxidase subunit I [Chloroflexi bacterium]|nr:cytochrome ubiquinol oxidase subunit I [Chloroflexota bacterium]MCL5107505.1 cytochrome ubiquinol oxidase subunit I [Chloroflexota bacterium]
MEPTAVPELARRFVIALLFLTHVQFAAFLIGIFTIAVACEFFALVFGGDNLMRVARGLGKTAALVYSTGAVLAFMVMFFATIFFPTFWYTILRTSFWALFLEGITFALTILYLLPWYFTWEHLERFRWVHLSLGGALIVAAYFQQSLIDVVASYMLTPAPPEEFLRVLFNATAIPLDMHRIVGDISFAGFLVAGYAAFRALRSREPADHAYYDWLGSLGLLAGLGFLFLQPAIGIEYVEEIRAVSPGAFNAMMRTHNSWLFLLQVAFLSVLFLLSMLYMLWQLGKSDRSGYRRMQSLLAVAALSAVVLLMPRVIGPSQEYMWINWVNPLGAMQPWKYIAFAGLTLSAIFAVATYVGRLRKGLRWGYLGGRGRQAQYLLLTLAVFASFMMALMGFIRENSRVPFLIYYQQQLDQPEAFPTLLPTPTPAGPASHFQSAPVGEPERGLPAPKVGDV